jgi:hypothetical protein
VYPIAEVFDCGVVCAENDGVVIVGVHSLWLRISEGETGTRCQSVSLPVQSDINTDVDYVKSPLESP